MTTEASSSSSSLSCSAVSIETFSRLFPRAESIQRKNRKSTITDSELRCFSGMKIVNETVGCFHRCIYCYANNPKSIPILYDNLPEQLVAKLNSMRILPSKIYFSTTCDLFQPHPEILLVTHQLLEIILSRGISVAFLTKGEIPEVTMNLLAKYPHLVQAQIGLNTPDEKISSIIEPGAAVPEKRFQNIERLVKAGIKTSIRLDPLIHGLTDNQRDLNIIFERVSRYRSQLSGTTEIKNGVQSQSSDTTKDDRKEKLVTNKVTTAAISYLFLRKGFAKRIEDTIKTIRQGYDYQSELLGCETPITVLDPKLRKQLYSEIDKIASKYNIQTKICGCKNQDIFDTSSKEDICTRCHIAGDDMKKCSSKIADIEDSVKS